MKIFALLLLVGSFSFNSLVAQEKKTATEQQAAYMKTLHERALKIVDNLALTDQSKKDLVTNIISTQYFELNKVHDAHNALVKDVKNDATRSKDDIQNIINESEAQRDAKLKALHHDYIASLSRHLNNDQVNQVKDGMTYGVVHVTYKAYQDMLPDLTGEQKAKIWDWLVEAREHAMDAGSSKDKHAWFGKYKGRINNYLSAEGYDLKKAGDDWEKRRNAAKESS